jgi:hypothetical protein
MRPDQCYPPRCVGQCRGWAGLVLRNALGLRERDLAAHQAGEAG